MAVTITEMKQTLMNSGVKQEELAKLSEKQIKARYEAVCKQLTSAISGSDSKSDTNVYTALGIENCDYNKILAEHNKKIDELIANGDYLKAAWEFLNPPKNPNLTTGVAPDVFIGGAGFGKAVIELLKNPGKILKIASAAKKYSVKSMSELGNLIKNFIVQSKASRQLPEYVDLTQKSGYSVKNVVEAFRFGNVKKNIPIKIAEKISKSYQLPIEKVGKDIKVVQAEVNGQVKTYFSYFNPKDGKAMLLNESGEFEAFVDFQYDKAGKLVDAVMETNGYGNGGQTISSRLFNPKATLRLD